MESEVNTINDELTRLSGRRTTVIHSFWTIDETGKLTRAKYKKDIGSDANILENKDVTMQSIVELPEDILKAVKKFGAFNKKIIKLLGL